MTFRSIFAAATGHSAKKSPPFPTRHRARNQPVSPKESGRLQLAQWLTQQDHPLTSRVMVNRIWRWHFGRGIVPSRG